MPVTPKQFTSVVAIGFNLTSAYFQAPGKERSALAGGAASWPLVWRELHQSLGSHAPSALSRFLQERLSHSGGGVDQLHFLAAQYYYNADSKKIRIDSTLMGGFLSCYDYYAYGNEWIYTFTNTNPNSTCRKYNLNKSSFPDVNWLQTATYVGTETILGIETYHWHGKGNHLGPNVGFNIYDYYVATKDNTPVLISNPGFAQYFMTFDVENISQAFWNYPQACVL